MSSLVSTEVFEPYATALMSIAQSQNLVDRFGDDVAYLLNLIRESADLQEFLANPFVQVNDKKAVLKQITGDPVHPLVQNFLMVLVDRRRILFLEGICQQFQVRLRQLKQTVLAEVMAAVSLSETQRQAISQQVIALTGAHQVDLDVRIDPDLIGGVIIKVGSQVIDASLRGQLRRIGIRLTSAL
ncbi:ATP synthase F0F1 subunit delta [Neosynechococcus sphagnicola sy1]|uniref:ATP synthase subunit delta n=1 Tax=Neosynechococcus sphagnicola sy1 TaxID=1497020 RepID=A0A098TNW2_9CYAN|nr:ATP synthase F1 subunit delta [Neosynechococcus sphagnicola]KGF73951.1 ATP synthase F0F1 subunit delta [Neosynechococcus sphagnicola sy1]